MLAILNSADISKRIQQIVEILFKDRTIKEIVLLTFIIEILNIDFTLRDICFLLNKQMHSASIMRNPELNSFFDIQNNSIKLKSSIVAFHVLQKGNYNQDISDVLIKILGVLDRHRHVGRYRNALRLLVAYSNLRMILSQKDSQINERIIKIFEAAKMLEHNKKNHFFGYNMLLPEWKITTIVLLKFISIMQKNTTVKSI